MNGVLGIFKKMLQLVVSSALQIERIIATWCRHLFCCSVVTVICRSECACVHHVFFSRVFVLRKLPPEEKCRSKSLDPFSSTKMKLVRWVLAASFSAQVLFYNVAKSYEPNMP